MDAAAVKEVAALAREAEQGRTNLRWSPRPDGAGYMAVEPGSMEIREIPTPTPPYRMRAGSLGGLVGMIKAAPMRAAVGRVVFAGPKGDGSEIPPMCVGRVLAAVGAYGVVVVLDDDGQRTSRLELEMPPTAMMRYLLGLSKGDSKEDLKEAEGDPESREPEWLTQQEMIDLLDLGTDDGEVDPSTLRASIAAIRFAQSSGGEAVVATGRQSRSQSVVRELGNVDGSPLPSSVRLRVRVSGQHVGLNERGQVVSGHSGLVRCVLQIDTERLRMRLAPMEEDMLNLRRGAVAWVIQEISNKLAGTGVRCEVVDGELVDA